MYRVACVDNRVPAFFEVCYGGAVFRSRRLVANDSLNKDEVPPRGGTGESAVDWRAVHERLVSLGKARAAHERAVCGALVEAKRLGVAARLGYASLREYAERVLGLNGRQTEERLRVGRALVELPGMDAALATGELCWSVVRELTRVAVADTEDAWVSFARGMRSRDVERAVARRAPGEAPEDPGDAARVAHRLRFDVQAETMAAVRDAQAALGRELGHAVDDDTFLLSVMRAFLAGPPKDDDDTENAERAVYQVAVIRCDACRATSMEAGGASHEVSDAVAEMVACDAQDIGTVDEAGPRAGARAPSASTKAAQSVPPRVRRLVMRRHRGRCAVPGCQHHRHVEVHHIDPRCENGGHDPERLVVLCAAHHRLTHAGALIIEGSAAEGFVFCHADGSPYGQPASPAQLDVAQQVHAALTNMGFRPSEARARVDAARELSRDTSLEGWLRAALRYEVSRPERRTSGAARGGRRRRGSTSAGSLHTP